MKPQRGSASALWDNDLIQFARLLSEVRATQPPLDLKALCERMDLYKNEIEGLFDRAERVWENAKTPPKDFDSWRTAIKRGETPSKPATALSKSGLLRKLGVKKLLDYGWGWAQDHKAYRKCGVATDKYDPAASFKACQMPAFNAYDMVTMMYVVNTLPPVPRADAVRAAARHVRLHGVLLLVSRMPGEVSCSARNGEWERHEDGYYSGKGFQRGL